MSGPIFGENSSKSNLPPVDKLESDTLPPSVEDAEAEYFADMAFDDRLLYLLANESSKITLSLAHKTSALTNIGASALFSPNSTEVVDITLDDDHIEELEVPAFSYRMEGRLEQYPGRLEIDAIITPDDTYGEAIHIESTPHSPDVFYISRRGEKPDVEIIDTKELFYVLCQLGGASKQSIDQVCTALTAINQNKPSIFRANIEEVWRQLGETHGEITTATELSHIVETPAREDFPEKIKLRREEVETADATFIKLFLEHTTEMTTLDVEESYCLTLVFEQVNSRNTEKNAEKVIVSGISPRMITLDIERKSKGRVTKLDLDTASIKELFVNWFDQLVSH
jgi:hypothetical protein